MDDNATIVIIVMTIMLVLESLVMLVVCVGNLRQYEPEQKPKRAPQPRGPHGHFASSKVPKVGYKQSWETT